ncbi:uncharacterized protein DDB_G0283357 [Contarinia nasturtii]|uniref:uncharacterized protein DDB_G0283357 n=1 Tax=Contarinia nasturtii TaxID=265458 RepID=UPI0012D44EAA|nr:uncharacterized protein DDB_G0283357 [Contarinia nasturtii]
MYTVNQGPSKLVAKTRTGLSQNYDKIETIRKIKVNNAQLTKAYPNNNAHQDKNNISDNSMDINVARPVFQQYRRSNSNRNNSLYKSDGIRIAYFKDDEPQPDVSPQYEELIQYIRDSWNVLSAKYEDINEQNASSSTTVRTRSISSTNSVNSNQNINNSNKKVIAYHDLELAPSPALEDFGPFDLESWWGRRLFNNITNSL